MGSTAGPLSLLLRFHFVSVSAGGVFRRVYPCVFLLDMRRQQTINPDCLLWDHLDGSCSSTISGRSDAPWAISLAVGSLRRAFIMGWRFPVSRNRVSFFGRGFQWFGSFPCAEARGAHSLDGKRVDGHPGSAWFRLVGAGSNSRRRDDRSKTY